MIVVIDSGIANIGSVTAALRRVGVEPVVASNSEAVRRAGALLLPGVGAFGDGMASLQRNALVEPIRTAVMAGVPILGICLGMQLLADESEEFGSHRGLGLVPGRVVRLEPTANERVPNIGWCDVSLNKPSRLYRDIAPGTSFYFVHSYHLVCHDAVDVAASIAFGQKHVTVALERGNIFGAQFHPEKSQDAGLTILAAFARHVAERISHVS